MRVWDTHPGYLSRNSLLGQHAEIHALISVICNDKKAYGSHPETLRWKGRLQELAIMHEFTVKEMQLRGFRHASPCPSGIPGNSCDTLPGRREYVDHPAQQIELLREKNRSRSSIGRIPLPVRGSDYWAHHKYSVMARGYNYYREVQSFMGKKEDLPVSREHDLIEKVLGIMELPVKDRALCNTIDHLWGYFKEETSREEKQRYLQRSKELAPDLIYFFYNLALKYKKIYLLHSTIFADFVEKEIWNQF